MIGLLSSYTLSEGRMANDAARAAQARSAPAWSFDALLRELIDEQDYPRLYRIAWAPGAEGDTPSPDQERREFLFGIELILDGVQALIDRARRSRSGTSESL